MLSRILICDDSQEYCDLTSSYITEITKDRIGKVKIDTFDCLSDTQKAVDAHEYDLYFLDVELDKGRTGLELAKQIDTNGNGKKIVFMTAHDNYVYDCLDFMPLHFIKKDELKEGIKKVLIKYMKEYAINQEVLQIDPDTEVVLEDIMYFVKENRKTVLQSVLGLRYETWMNLNELEQKYKEHWFVRIERNIIINLKFVSTCKKFEVTMSNGATFKIAVRRFDNLAVMFADYASAGNW